MGIKEFQHLLMSLSITETESPLIWMIEFCESHQELRPSQDDEQADNKFEARLSVVT